MNAKQIYEDAATIKNYLLKNFNGSDTLTQLQKEHLAEKFCDFATKNPRIFDDIVSGSLDWDKFKRLAEMAHSLHLQMNTNTDPEKARNVSF